MLTENLQIPSLQLLPHPTHSSAIVESLLADVSWERAQGLRVIYRCTAKPGHVMIPAPASSGFTDGLWQHTCCELFVAEADSTAYREFNFAPSGAWAVYAFAACRERIALIPEVSPSVRFDSCGEGWTLTAYIPAALLPMTGALQLGLSAVIEGEDGTLNYHALAHPQPAPDFHDRRSFVLSLPVTVSEDSL